MSPHQLISKQQHSLELEFPAAKGKEILEAGAEQIHDHHIVVSLHTKPAHKGHAHIGSSTRQHFVDLGLVGQLRVNRLGGLKLDGHLLSIRYARS